METLTLGPFRLVETVGEGTMGRVYRGRHRLGGTEVAVKVMTSDLARREYFQRRFRREVEAMAQLNHPSVVRIFDLGKVPEATAEASEGMLPVGSPWLAMEFVEGVSLAHRSKAWGWPRIRWVLLELLDALAHSHATGVIHRDLKPANVLIRHDSRHGFRLTLVDFGVARIVDPDDEGGGGEVEERIAGTPKYMAPEQILGRRRDQGPWTDLYALGCLAYRIVAGSPPFDDAEMEDVFQAHLERSIPPLETALEVPEGFEDWLGRLLAKNPYDRFRRAADAAQNLLEISSVHGLSEPTSEVEDSAGGPGNVEGNIALEETAVSDSDSSLAEESSVSIGPGGAETSGHVGGTPSVPASWRRPDARDESAQIRGAGLVVFGLRRVPLVDRERERDLLWDVLRRVVRRKIPEAVVLHGATGYGKTRLMEWLARKGHEAGAVSVFWARQGQKNAARRRIGAVLARHFRCVGMETEALVERLERLYENLGMTGVAAHHDILGMVEMMAAASGDVQDEAVPEGFSSPEERNRALVRLFEGLARRRPVLMCLEGIREDGDCLSCVAHILREVDEALPLMAVLTVGDADGQERGESFETVSGSDRVTELEVGPLPDGAQRELVEQLLGLEPELAAEVARRTEGNPMFAVQLVGDWVERGVLELGPEGFQVGADQDPEVPDDIFGVWNRRVQQFLGAFSDERRRRVRAALESAAAMGPSVGSPAWRVIAEEIGLQAPKRLVDRMVRSGLADRDAEGWSFIHGMLRESLRRAAREAGRWRQRHRLCVDVLCARRDLATPGVASRIADHLVKADEIEAALPYLQRAMRQTLEAGEYDRTADLLERRAGLMDRLELADSARERVQNWVVHGELLGAAGQPERALKWARRAVDCAEARGWFDELGDAHRLRATVRREDSAFETALQDCRRALECFEETDNQEGMARTRYIQGRIHQMMGETDEAEEAFVRAIEWFKSVSDRSMQALITGDIGYIWIMEGRYEQARRGLKVGLRLAQEVGNRRVAAKCWNRLGEIARFEHDWETARECYQKAEELFRVARNRHVTNLNLAFVELADGNYETAESFLMILRKSFSSTGVHFPPVLMGLACCAAASGDWEGWEVRFDRCVESLEESGMAHADLPWLAEKAGRLARQAGETERARRAFAFAAQQWAQLGDTDAATGLMERIEDLPDGPEDAT